MKMIAFLLSAFWTGKLILVGSLSGFAAGMSIGLLNGNDKQDDYTYYMPPRTAFQNGIRAGIFFCLVGAGVGGVTGSTLE